MEKTKVTILGGGLSGLVTAYNLTAPEQQDRYEVTVYQLGWRLGGKCATGRNRDVNARIQEHGLHVFMGQYDNAFRLVQQLYGEAAHPPFARWSDAFTQQPAMTLMENIGGAWLPWVIDLPVMPGTPGIDAPPSLWKRIGQFLEWLEHRVLHVHCPAFPPGQPAGGPVPLWRRIIHFVRRLLGREAEHVGRKLLRGVIDAVDRLDRDPAGHVAADHHRLAATLRGLRDWISRCIQHLLAKDTELRRFWILADLGLTSLIGGLVDGLILDPAANLERVNRQDYKNWLRSHGADELTVESAIVRALYDLIFAFPEGDVRGDGDVEAGTLFLSLANTACYQGSIIWKFNTATGDAVIQPLYEVLKARGVSFEFFSRVDRLVPSPDRGSIARVEIGRQVALETGVYEPLWTLPSGQRVWPDRPLYDQIVDGGRLRAADVDLESHWTTWPDALPPKTIEAGRDYELLILAIPPAAHREICADLIAQKPEWKAMSDAIQTTATQSFQTWMTAGESSLGWNDPSIVGGFDQSELNCWGDISEVLKTECWPASSNVVAEQIACGPLPCPAYPPPRSDVDYPSRMQAEADAVAKDYLDGDGRIFWCNRFGPDGPSAGTVASTYSRANIDPGERYTLTVTDSTRHRMRACDSTYANLFLTGDWIQNGQNLGSFEATTISAMLASRAISGFPNVIARTDASRYSQAAGAKRATAGLPRFVEHGGMTTFPGKIQLDGTTMWAFMLEADQAKLQAFCRKVFDEPSGGAVRVMPLASLMMMTIVDIARGRFVDARPMGWSRERELTFWIPAVRVAERDGRTVATHFDMVMPYLVLDNPVAIASGREIFGYFKQAGVIGLPGDRGRTDDDLSVDLFATKSFGADSEEVMQRLLTLTPVGERPSTILPGIRSFEEGARALHAHLRDATPTWHPSLEFDIDVLADVFARRVPQLFLKQFRDVADGRFACYQAITEAMGEVTWFDAAPQLVEYDMALTPLDSSPIAADFGFAPTQRVVGARFEYDMVIHPGRVIWEA